MHEAIVLGDGGQEDEGVPEAVADVKYLSILFIELDCERGVIQQHLSSIFLL